MSKPVDSNKSYSISELADKIITEQPSPEVQIEKLEEKCFQLNKIVLDLKTLVEQKESEIAHLKKMLEGSSSIIMPLSDEEEIAAIQLEKLKTASKQRALTYEEIKMYDLLVKNKRLSQGEVTEIAGSKRIAAKDKTSLISIASSKVKKK